MQNIQLLIVDVSELLLENSHTFSVRNQYYFLFDQSFLHSPEHLISVVSINAGNSKEYKCSV